MTHAAPTLGMPARTVCLFLICALIVLAYWRGLGGGYVFDDYPNIVDNTALHLEPGATAQQWISASLSSPSKELKRPLAMISFAANFALTGADPYWMKATNLFIHLLNTCLVFALARVLLRLPRHGVLNTTPLQKALLPLWIAAAWGLHPINVTPVLLVVQRMESLCHTFVLAGLWMYAAGRMRTLRTGHGWRQAGSGLVLGTGLGLLSKESAILLPVYALALEIFVLDFSTQRTAFDRRLLWSYAIALCTPTFAGLAWLLPSVTRPEAFAHRDFTLSERLLTETRVVLDYLLWTLLPRLNELGLYHDDYQISRGWLSPPSTLVAAGLLTTLAGAIVLLRKRRPIMALGLAWFVSAHLLTATIIPLELVFEHRNYFASFGVLIAMADLMALLANQGNRRVAITLGAALLALYATTTTLRALEWRNPVTFAANEAQKRPTSPRATYEFARQLIIATNSDLSSPLLPEAWAALNHAMQVPNASAMTEVSAIVLAYRTGQDINPHWWTQLQRKLSSRSPGPQEVAAIESLVDCAISKVCNAPHVYIVDTCLSALAHGPHPGILHAYGNYALNALNDPALTLQLWQDAVRMAPEQIQFQESLVKLLIYLREFDLADKKLSELRQQNHLGQLDSSIKHLDARLRRARQEP